MRSTILADLRSEKLHQARDLLLQFDIPAWVIIQNAPMFTLSDIGRDPAVKVMEAPSAFELAIYVITPQSARIFYNSMVTEPVTSGWEANRVDSPFDALASWLYERNIRAIAVNSDSADARNDGLTASLAETLALKTKCAFLPSSNMLSLLWQLKTTAELTCLKYAQSESAAALEELAGVMQIGWGYKDIADWMRCWGAARGYSFGWSADYSVCPIVGFAHPKHLYEQVTPGQTMYVDFSYLVDGFCSDLQRTYYVLSPGETQTPSDIEHAFRFGMETLDLLRRTCRPGIAGYEAFEAVAPLMKEAGYRFTFPHVGHPIGRSVNTTGALLEPRSAPRSHLPLRAGEVYSLPLRFWSERDDHCIIGVEEVVHVGETETVYLSPLQTHVWPIGRLA